MALEVLIRDTQATLDRAKQHRLNETMPEDYQALLDILDTAIKQQRKHTLAMLSSDSVFCRVPPVVVSVV